MSNCAPLCHVAATRPGAAARRSARTSLVDDAHVQLLWPLGVTEAYGDRLGDVTDDRIAGAPIAIRPVALVVVSRPANTALAPGAATEIVIGADVTACNPLSVATAVTVCGPAGAFVQLKAYGAVVSVSRSWAPA